MKDVHLTTLKAELMWLCVYEKFSILDHTLLCLSTGEEKRRDGENARKQRREKRAISN